MSIKDEFENGLGALMGKVKAGDTQAMKATIVGDVHYAGSVDTIEDGVTLSEELTTGLELLTTYTVLLKELKQLTLYERLERLPELLADIDQKSYLGMSKRRKKRFLSRLRMFERSTGKLASIKHLSRKGFSSIPMIHVFVEKTGAGFNKFMNQWLGIVTGDTPSDSAELDYKPEPNMESVKYTKRYFA